MSLTYDGIIHRSLEEQVRYDAEQVQLLKQADVTINENLQTINTEINGKLTKPANPSEESAVTILVDGTVGTKPLSEISGGGGKIYQHKIIIYLNQEEFTTFQCIGLYIYSNRNTAYTVNDFPYGTYVGAAYDSAKCGALAVSFEDAGTVLMTFGGAIYRDNEVKGVTYLKPLNHNTLDDTVTEL